jgi:two-component system response regulator LytT
VAKILERLPVKNTNGSIDLIEIESIFFLEAKEGDTIIRTKRKKPYRSVQRLHELANKLPSPPFVQCHREYIVNLNRVRSITPRKTQDYDFRLDPPVNKRMPIARDRLSAIHKILGL